jgi:hypothetical protein
MPKQRSLLTSIAAKAVGAGVVVALGGVAAYSLFSKPKKQESTLRMQAEPEPVMPVIIRRSALATGAEFSSAPRTKPGLRRPAASDDDEDDEVDRPPPPAKSLPLYKRLVSPSKPSLRRPAASDDDEDDDADRPPPPAQVKPLYKRLVSPSKPGFRRPAASDDDEEEEDETAPAARAKPRFMQPAPSAKPSNDSRSASAPPSPPVRPGMKRIPVSLPPVSSGVLFPSAARASAEAANMRVIKRSSSPQVADSSLAICIVSAFRISLPLPQQIRICQAKQLNCNDIVPEL